MNSRESVRAFLLLLLFIFAVSGTERPMRFGDVFDGHPILMEIQVRTLVSVLDHKALQKLLSDRVAAVNEVALRLKIESLME
ncbi:hypothetical protein QR680_005834 [Steinernema hermaphroditum]|uniref:Uncharacterized protein n=1 Tax=Steinernema hermaphroditum TaxID=289476 RepID=A0AA39HTI5_9BILA|nr:hypothetical protein QR680_005834 [Steinernema hermaphroditum]